MYRALPRLRRRLTPRVPALVAAKSRLDVVTERSALADPAAVFGAAPVTVWCFLAEYESLLRIAAALPPGAVLADGGEAVNRCFLRHKEALRDLDRAVLGSRDRVLWDASDLGERNPYTSGFLLRCCRALALAEALRSGGAHVAVVPDADTAEAFRAVAQRAGVAVAAGPRRPLYRRVPSFMRGILAGLVAQAGEVRTVRRRIVALAPSRAGRLAAAQGADILLVGSVDAGALVRSGGAEAGRFFGRLPGLLREAGHRIAHLALPLAWTEPPAAMAAAATAPSPVVFLEDCLGPLDLARSFLGTMRFRFARHSAEVAGLDVTPLLRLEARLEFAKPRQFHALLYRAVGRRLAGSGVAPRRVIVAAENQPWERMLRAGLRRWVPAARIVAAQHAPFSPMYLAIPPTPDEIARHTAPDLVVAIGEDWAAHFVASGVPPDRVVVGGALRYEHLAASRSGVAARAAPDRAAPRILCPATVGFQESIELVHKTLAALRDLPSAILTVNFHPATGAGFRDALRRLVAEFGGEAAGRIVYSDAAASALLPATDLVVYNASASAIEALAAGIPVVFLGSDLALDIDKVMLPGIRRCRSPEALRVAIAELLEGRPVPPLAGCFAPVRPEIWHEIAGGAGVR